MKLVNSFINMTIAVWPNFPVVYFDPLSQKSYKKIKTYLVKMTVGIILY